MFLIQRCSSGEQSVHSLLAKIASLENARFAQAKRRPFFPRKKEGKEKISLQILSPDAIYSPLCIKAALEMSKEKNFLLTTLALAQNFSSALKVAGAKDAKDFVLVAWDKNKKKAPSWGKISGALGLEKLPWGKKNIAHFSKFYGISKEALNLYSLEKLIIEKMALSKF